MDRSDAKRYYERVIRAVTLQTSAPGESSELPPAVRERSLRTVLCAHAGMPVDRYETAFAAARENAAIVAGSGFVSPVGSRSRVVAAIEYVTGRCENPRGFVAAANGVLA